MCRTKSVVPHLAEDEGDDIMSEQVKVEILKAWNRYIGEHSRRYAKNEGSTAQHEDYCRIFKEGVKNHAKLSKAEKDELLLHISRPLSPHSS